MHPSFEDSYGAIIETGRDSMKGLGDKRIVNGSKLSIFTFEPLVQARPQFFKPIFFGFREGDGCAQFTGEPLRKFSNQLYLFFELFRVVFLEIFQCEFSNGSTFLYSGFCAVLIKRIETRLKTRRIRSYRDLIIHIPVQITVTGVEAEWVLADPFADGVVVPAGVVALHLHVVVAHSSREGVAAAFGGGGLRHDLAEAEG